MLQRAEVEPSLTVGLLPRSLIERKTIARTDEEENIQTVDGRRNSLFTGPDVGLPVQASTKTNSTGESRDSRAACSQQRSSVFSDDYPTHTGGTCLQGGRLR